MIFGRKWAKTVLKKKKNVSNLSRLPHAFSHSLQRACLMRDAWAIHGAFVIQQQQ